LTANPTPNNPDNRPDGDKSSCTALIVLDGWGHNTSPKNNAIAAANTPNWDNLWQHSPQTLLGGSGLDVGLPDGQMGNSEVGHMNLGAGRVVNQDLTRITRAIADGSFLTNPALTRALAAAKTPGVRLHIFGLLSDGGVHSHEDQINEFIAMAAAEGVAEVYLHAFLDGRDTPPQSAAASLEKTVALFANYGNGRVASICGRYYAMDRDNRWDRIERAWNMLVNGQAEFEAEDTQSGLEAAYARGENDEFVVPTFTPPEHAEPATIGDGDVVVFMNYRADRARQITAAFTRPDFAGFERTAPTLASFTTLTQYADSLPVACAFPPEQLTNTLGEYLADNGKTQLRIAETEKYAHVTFFFSGGREAEYRGEQRTLIPSPDVATYDLQPQMSAPELTAALVAAIKSGEFDAIVCNYANGDMVGHTGVFDAAVKACETIDASLGQIMAALDEVGGQCLITADHGNVERMFDDATDQPHTAHTCEPVPLVYYGPATLSLAGDGTLSDVAPSLLQLMGLSQPAEMTGRSLIEREPSQPREQRA